jgi:REP element-mobilizing transposase RayT
LNIYGRRRRSVNEKLQYVMRTNMKRDALLLNEAQREAVKTAIRTVCEHRNYELWAVNVLTNHFHAVVSAQSRPEPMADAFKSYATRKLRNDRLIGADLHPWARGRSRRYLWKPKHISRAIDYVLYGQSDFPDFND